MDVSIHRLISSRDVSVVPAVPLVDVTPQALDPTEVFAGRAGLGLRGLGLGARMISRVCTFVTFQGLAKCDSEKEDSKENIHLESLAQH